ncbi:hypothetical protein [Streptomyces sp. NPDC090022]|uniref:hypothetical protein n=1 Tax=Streptomyces sp. NPDC090022 TaxID=3365920 RepID=UPI00382413D4
MRVDVAWWDLEGTGQSIASMRAHLHEEGIGAWTGVPGLVLKLWLADETANRWGAVMLWSERPADGVLPPNRAAELIGTPPAHRCRFDVEAAVEGEHPLTTLGGLGPAFALSQGVPSNA